MKTPSREATMLEATDTQFMSVPAAAHRSAAPVPSHAARCAQAAERGEALYCDGMFCCETVLTVANEAAGHRLPQEVMALGSGFWGGIAGDGSMCGALVGGIMAVGMLAGRTDITGEWLPSSEAVTELRAMFTEAHGSVSCDALVSRFGGMDGEGRREHCARLTGHTAATVVGMAESRGWI